MAHLQLLFLFANFMLGVASRTILSYFGDPTVGQHGTWSAARVCGNATGTIGASVTLTFFGTGATIVGPLQPDAGTISITLDGKEQVNVDNYGDAILCNRVFYRTPVLQNGRHQLVATLIGKSHSGSNQPTGFAMEYFSYTIPDDVQPTTSPKVTVPAVIGIAIGGTAAGSITLGLIFCCLPIIRRKSATRGAVTGIVLTGTYKIVNDKYLNTASANDTDEDPIGGVSYQRVPHQQWRIDRQENGRYKIRNHQHSTIFAGWPNPRPMAGDDVVNLNEGRASGVEWVIQETTAGSRKYHIRTTEGNLLYWGLPDIDPNTPISLEKRANKNCLWTLCLLDAA